MILLCLTSFVPVLKEKNHYVSSSIWPAVRMLIKEIYTDCCWLIEKNFQVSFYHDNWFIFRTRFRIRTSRYWIFWRSMGVGVFLRPSKLDFNLYLLVMKMWRFIWMVKIVWFGWTLFLVILFSALFICSCFKIFAGRIGLIWFGKIHSFGLI